MFTLGSQGKTIPLGEAPPGGAQATPLKASGPADYFLFMLIAINVVAFLAVGGMFAYVASLESKLTSLKSQLTAEAEAIKSKNLPLQDMLKVSSKIQAISQIYKTRPYTSGVFSIIERAVDDNVIFGEMSANLDPKSKQYLVTLKGEARGYTGVINQVKILEDEAFRRYVSGVALDKEYTFNKSTGMVQFKLLFNTVLSGVKPADLANNLPAKRTVLQGLGDSFNQTPQDQDLFDGILFGEDQNGI